MSAFLRFFSSKYEHSCPKQDKQRALDAFVEQGKENIMRIN